MVKSSRIESIERATGRTWNEWMVFMDSIGAEKLNHAAIAASVAEDLDGTISNSAWWAQSVAVAYEQVIGRRLPGQSSDGTFQMNVSKSTNYSMQELMDKWVKFAQDSESVREIISEPARVSGIEKRITWRVKAKNGSNITVTSEPKKNGTAAIMVTQMGLTTNQLKDEIKSQWAIILNRFLQQLV
jgi:hypothetical protein